MAQPDPCVICLTPLANYTTLRCCGRPCHVACAHRCRRNGQNPLCPRCQVPLTVLEVLHEEWKEDPEFVQHVKTDWKDNPLWYGLCNQDAHVLEGFWGELRDRYEPHLKTLYFLGHTKTQAISRMKTCISFA